uniref:Uncharacterized protein n=1 Tax=Brassica oleracea TaxID=3712 RepID=A0A3P6D6D5_BRAOL|nr:unnamed protein product [Brassica oleracea]
MELNLTTPTSCSSSSISSSSHEMSFLTDTKGKMKEKTADGQATETPRVEFRFLFNNDNIRNSGFGKERTRLKARVFACTFCKKEFSTSQSIRRTSERSQARAIIGQKA